MTVELMRLELLKAYPGDKWAKKVKRMAANQVIAVYHSVKKTKEEKKMAQKQTEVKPGEYQQIRMEELI